MATDIPLPALFTRALNAASKAHNLPTVQDDTQELIQSALADLQSLSSRITALSLFSSNDTLEDVSTRDLVYILVPFVSAELEGRVKAIKRSERMVHLKIAQKRLRTFVDILDNYEIVPAAEKELCEKTLDIKDPAKRRGLKIKQYQKEKELRARIEVIRKRRGQQFVPEVDPTDFALITSLLPSPSSTSSVDDEDEDDSETDDILREATLLLLRLTYTQARGQLEGTDQELELLRSAPPSPSSSVPTLEKGKGKSRDEGDMWKLEAPARSNGGGPLLDLSGKPLQPFTILPTGASDRARLQSQVFGPGHRLPTMSIDEYLKIERERGNILTGGGPQSELKPTSSERLTVDAEQDGTAFGEDKAEEKRLKDENWARYTDVNPRGAGNTMNRG